MTFQNATEAFEYYYDEILEHGEYTDYIGNISDGYHTFNELY